MLTSTATNSGPAPVFATTISPCPDSVTFHFTLKERKTVRNFVVMKGQRTSVLISAPAAWVAFHHASDQDGLPRKEESSETKRLSQSLSVSSASFLVKKKDPFRSIPLNSIELSFLWTKQERRPNGLFLLQISHVICL